MCVLRPRPEPHVPRSPQQGPDPDLGEAARHILLPTGLLAISIIGAQFNHGMMVCHREKLPREINIVETQEQRVKAEEKNVRILVNVYVNEESKIIYIMLSRLGHCEVFFAFILNGLTGHW